MRLRSYVIRMLAAMLVLGAFQTTIHGEEEPSPSQRIRLSASTAATFAPLELTNRFDGTEHQFTSCGPCSDPASPQVAVGRDQFLEDAGGSLAVYTKPNDGSAPELLQRTDISDLLDLVRSGDPRLLYDQASDRYFISDHDDDTLVVGVSASGDATGPWYLWRQRISPPGSLDQPKLTVTTDKVVVGAYGGWWVLQKSDVLAATASPLRPRVATVSTDIDTYGTDDWAATSSGTPNAYLERTLQKSARGYGMDGVAVVRVTGTPAEGNVHVDRHDLDLTHTEDPEVTAPQPANPQNLNIGPLTADITSAAWRNNQLWMTLTDRCVPSGSVRVTSCIRLVDVDTSTADGPKLTRDIDLGIADTWLSFPAVDIDPSGTVAVVANASSPSLNPSVVATQVSNVGDAAPWVTVRAGDYTKTTYLGNPGYTRFGDYSGISSDPADPHRFWMGSMIGNSEHSWGTAFGVAELTPSPPSPSPARIAGSPTRVTTFGAVVTVTGTADPGSTVGIWFKKAGASGYSQRRTLTASSTGAWSTTYVANDDYRVYAVSGVTPSASILVQVAPTISGATLQTVRRGTTYTITGTATPAATVTLHFHRAGTAASDYSIVRPVAVATSGKWSRSYVADVDYRFYASLPNGRTSTTVLVQAR